MHRVQITSRRHGWWRLQPHTAAAATTRCRRRLLPPSNPGLAPLQPRAARHRPAPRPSRCPRRPPVCEQRGRRLQQQPQQYGRSGGLRQRRRRRRLRAGAERGVHLRRRAVRGWGQAAGQRSRCADNRRCQAAPCGSLPQLPLLPFPQCLPLVLFQPLLQHRGGVCGRARPRRQERARLPQAGRPDGPQPPVFGAGAPPPPAYLLRPPPPRRPLPATCRPCHLPPAGCAGHAGTAVGPPTARSLGRGRLTRSIPPSSLPWPPQFEAAFPDKSAPLVVGCLSGKRSLAACDILSGAGYTNLQNVEGGYQGGRRMLLPGCCACCLAAGCCLAACNLASACCLAAALPHPACMDAAGTSLQPRCAAARPLPRCCLQPGAAADCPWRSELLGAGAAPGGGPGQHVVRDFRAILSKTL